MDFIKNLIVLIVSTLTYIAGVASLASLYMAVTKLDLSFLLLTVVLAAFVAVIVFVSKRFTRLRAALEFPFGLIP